MYSYFVAPDDFVFNKTARAICIVFIATLCTASLTNVFANTVHHGYMNAYSMAGKKVLTMGVEGQHCCDVSKLLHDLQT